MIVKVVVNSTANITYDITQFQVYWLINISQTGEINLVFHRRSEYYDRGQQKTNFGIIYWRTLTILSSRVMANFSQNGHFFEPIEVHCTVSLHGNLYMYSLAALNVLLSITASLGNILIFVALRKESSLHPLSKLLFRCLTLTDLFVGVFSQPLFAVSLIFIAHERLQRCYTALSIVDIAGRILSAVSLCTRTRNELFQR